MITLAKNMNSDVLEFIKSKNIIAVSLEENFGKNVWLIESRENGRLNGILTYSFMYSTWTRYNPFISLCLGENQKDMVNFLRKNFPGRLIRGCAQNSQDLSVLVVFLRLKA